MNRKADENDPALKAEPFSTRPEKRPRPNRYYKGPVSDHFDGHLFFNPDGETAHKVSGALKWRLTTKRTPWPKTWPSPHEPARPEARVGDGRLVVTMVGHATLLLQTEGLNILSDPVWAERVSPFAFAGPRRVNAPGIEKAHLPKIDIVLLSHNHYDHLDTATLAWLVERDNPLIVTPLGNDVIVRHRAPSARIAVGDWNDVVELGPKVHARFVPTHHWSARGVRDRRMALWASFVIETPTGPIYHIGDTGFFGGRNFREAGETYGPFRLACLPIGAYEPRWFMQPHHMNPAEAVAGFKLCKAATAVGHHWGTFRLTDEAVDAPRQALAEALAEQAIAPERFPALQPGMVVEVPGL